MITYPTNFTKKFKRTGQDVTNFFPLNLDSRKKTNFHVDQWDGFLGQALPSDQWDGLKWLSQALFPRCDSPRLYQTRGAYWIIVLSQRIITRSLTRVNDRTSWTAAFCGTKYPYLAMGNCDSALSEDEIRDRNIMQEMESDSFNQNSRIKLLLLGMASYF